VGVGVDEAGVGDVAPELEDLRLIAARASTSSWMPTAVTSPWSMRWASATGGSSSVTIRPTRTTASRSAGLDDASSLLGGATGLPAGEAVAARPQPAIATTTSAEANRRRNR
jgi:hypothetical protein